MEKMFDENGEEWIVGDVEELDLFGNDGWDPIMGDSEEWIDTDDMWLDDFQGEEDFA